VRESRREHYIGPVTDGDTKDALSLALSTLGARRGFATGDVSAELHLLASLALELQASLAPAVSAARREGLSWAGIGDLLGVTRASAWQRFGKN
jgi:hypothetical protein